MMRTEKIANKKMCSDFVSEKLGEILKDRDRITVLEAGCGSASHINFRNNIKLVGIDISKDQLQKNTLIHEKILGDIQTYPLTDNCFDVVICWDVLEHLPKPVLALENIFNSLKSGGVAVLAFPNLISLKGLFTKFSPYWIHILYYRWMGYTKKPFPTYFSFSMRPSNVKKIAERNGLSVEYAILFDGVTSKLVRYKVLHGIFLMITSLVNVLSLRANDLKASDCIMILRRR